MPQFNAGLKGDQRVFSMTFGKGLDLVGGGAGWSKGEGGIGNFNGKRSLPWQEDCE